MVAAIASSMRNAYGADRRFAWALGASLAAHALILSIHFGLPSAERIFRERPLDVVLVNAKTTRKPQKAEVLAQSNLDGGGNTDESRRARTPLPASTQHIAGDKLEAAQQRVFQLEKLQRDLLAQIKREAPKVNAGKTKNAQPQETPPTVSGRDLADNALAMARLQAEIDRNLEAYAKRPRRAFVGARAAEYRFARYVEDWRLKVERIGTLNYPPAARGKLYGNLIMTVIVRADGQVEAVEVNRSSGHKVLDDAARRIVQMAAPFAPFPSDIRRDTDIIEITRTWFFTRDDALRSQ
ncbi:MAG TPA: TonB family protein [Rhodocyclaceae bacterium]